MTAKSSAEMPSSTPQNAYVVNVATIADDWFGKSVSRPSKPACPELSVTPGLKPTWIAASGGLGKSSSILESMEPTSITGSANKS